MGNNALYRQVYGFLHKLNPYFAIFYYYHTIFIFSSNGYHHIIFDIGNSYFLHFVKQIENQIKRGSFSK